MADDLGDAKAIVLDNGSGVMKASFSGGEGAPRVTFPTIVGRPKQSGSSGREEVQVGDDAQYHAGILILNHPIEHGIVTAWDDMEKIWEHTISKSLCFSFPEEHPVLLTEAASNSEGNREKLAEVMFETFNFPAMYVAIQSVLALYASGRTMGLVLDSGFGVSSAVPVYEGLALPNGIHNLNLGGQELTGYLHKLLDERGISIHNPSNRDMVVDLKEKLSYVAIDFEQEMANMESSPSSYELPDGQEVTLTSERFRCPEALFKPSLAGVEGSGIHEMCYNSIMVCDFDIRSQLYGNIVIAGGNAGIAGIAERLTKEVTELAGTEVNASKPTSHQGDFSAWIGGDMLASHSSFKQMWISKSEFQESGASVAQRRAPLPAV
ncbi:unnamed protein product [Closterium sp. NIES-65]|nr:unnamed protein product [Closterium sp. NIES-65]